MKEKIYRVSILSKMNEPILIEVFVSKEQTMQLIDIYAKNYLLAIHEVEYDIYTEEYTD